MNSKALPWILSLAGLAAQPPSAGLREAARLDQAGRCDESEKIYSQALRQGTPAPSLLNNAGNHYLICGQPAKARDLFERLLRLQPNHPNATLQLARLAIGASDYARAEQLLSPLAAARPADFEVLFLFGQAAARANHLTRARDSLEAALRLQPDHPGAMLECGLAHAALGNLPRAVFLLARAQSRAPDQPGIALALARAAEDAGYYGDAVLAYDRYLALAPANREARRDRARVLSLTASGRSQGTSDLRQYLAANPGDALAHLYLAQVSWREDSSAALDHLAHAIRLDPKLAPAHVSRAWLLHRLGRDQEALSHLEAALRIVPSDHRALDQLGVVLLSLDRPAGAAAVLRKAAALAPDDPGIALHLGRALIDLGQEEEGQRWLDAYQRLRPQRQRDARSESGMIELATLDPAGRRAREIERFRSMARSRPDDPLLQLHLAGLLLADGQTAEARKEYQTLLSLNASQDIWAQAGRALLEAGEHAAARPFLERAQSRLELAEALLPTAGPEAALSALDAVPSAERSPAYLLVRASALDAANRQPEAANDLAAGLAAGPPHPSAARRASLLLAKWGRYAEALELLARAEAATPADPSLQLTAVIVLALSGEKQAAVLDRLRRLQTRWPEWDRPWIVHGLLLLEAKRPAEAAAKFRAATALGAPPPLSSCASLREWVFGTCRK